MILALCLVLTVLSGCSALNTAAPKATEAPVAQQQADSTQTASGANPVATIEIESFGKIVVELYPDVAPITVENFVNLAKEGFYDGLTFHRIISGFMIQGGCPQGTGTGGPGHTIKGEFALNGIKNDLSHTRGVISMARANDPDSAGSQFFIVHQDSTFLDGQYAAFGKVIEGLDVVDAVASTPTYASDKPKKKVVIKTITIA